MEIKETSDSKMAEFMMDGAIFTITRTILGPSDRFSYDLVMDGLEKGECRSNINPADK